MLLPGKAPIPVRVTSPVGSTTSIPQCIEKCSPYGVYPAPRSSALPTTEPPPKFGDHVSQWSWVSAEVTDPGQDCLSIDVCSHCSGDGRRGQSMKHLAQEGMLRFRHPPPAHGSFVSPCPRQRFLEGGVQLLHSLGQVVSKLPNISGEKMLTKISTARDGPQWKQDFVCQLNNG